MRCKGKQNPFQMKNPTISLLFQFLTRSLLAVYVKYTVRAIVAYPHGTPVAPAPTLISRLRCWEELEAAQPEPLFFPIFNPVSKTQGVTLKREKPLQSRLAHQINIFQHHSQNWVRKDSKHCKLHKRSASPRDAPLQCSSTSLAPSTALQIQQQKLNQPLSRSNDHSASQIRDVTPQSLKLLVQGFKKKKE